MTVGMLIDEEKEKAKKEGFSQGKIEAAIIAIKEFNLPIEQVAEKYDIPIEELKKQITL